MGRVVAAKGSEPGQAHQNEKLANGFGKASELSL